MISVDMADFCTQEVLIAVLAISFMCSTAPFEAFSVADVIFAGCFSVFTHIQLPLSTGFKVVDRPDYFLNIYRISNYFCNFVYPSVSKRCFV